MRITIEEAQKDKTLLDQFIIENQPLVQKVIWKNFGYAMQSGTFDDYFQIGCIGLIKATKNFNPIFKTTFSTYAVPMIIGEIQRYRRDYETSVIHISRLLQDKYYKYKRMKNEQISEDYICEELNISSGELSGIIMAIEGVASINQPLNYNNNDDSSYEFEDIISSKLDLENDSLNKFETKELIKKAKEILTEIEFKILLLHISGKTQPHIACETKMSQANVSRIIKRIKKICTKTNQIKIGSEDVMSNLKFCSKCNSIILDGVCSNTKCKIEEIKEENILETKEENVLEAPKVYLKNKETVQQLLDEGKNIDEIATLMGYTHIKYLIAIMVRWGLIDKKTKTSEEVLSPKIDCDHKEVKSVIEESQKNEPVNKISILKPRVLEGEGAEYEIFEDGLIIRDLVNKDNKFVVNSSSLDRFINELQEIKRLKDVV